MKSIVFCSSQRFKEDMEEFIDEYKRWALDKGKNPIIFDPEFEDMSEAFRNSSEEERMKDEYYKNSVAGRVYVHLFQKVRVADVCFIYNKDGYIGPNTIGELFAAAALGKIIYALEDKTMMGKYPNDLYEEPSARKLIHGIISDPYELYRKML